MNKFPDLIKENRLWEICFPRLAEVSVSRGIYFMRTTDQIMAVLETGHETIVPEDRIFIRIELICSLLWQQVQDLFISDFFPHLLAAATDIMRAVDFSDQTDDSTVPLIAELITALNAGEHAFAVACQPCLLVHAAEPTVWGTY